MTAPQNAGPWRTLRGYRFRLIGFVLFAAIAAYLWADSQPARYEATALAQLLSGRQLSGEFVSGEELRQLTNVTAEIARTRQVGEAAEARFDGRVDASIDIGTRSDVQVLTFTASSAGRQSAADFANAYAEALVEHLQVEDRQRRADATARIQARVDEILEVLDDEGLEVGDAGASAYSAELQALQTSAAQLQVRSGDAARIIQPATTPGAPVSPTPLRDAILAGIAAAVLGVFLVLLRARFSDRYETADDAAQDLGIQVIGELPRRPLTDPASVEAVRSLRTSVAFLLRDEAHPVLLTTSAAPGAGKTHVCAVLARAFAAEGSHVVAVDGDLRRPALHERLGAPLQPGIGDLVGGVGGVDELTVQSTASSDEVRARGGRLEVVTAGKHVNDPAEALSSDRMRQALRALVQAYDVIILDSPPTLAVVDPVVLTRYADGVVLVIDGRKDRRSEVRKALQTLRAVEANVLGLVFNNSVRTRQQYQYYGRTAPEPAETGDRKR